MSFLSSVSVQHHHWAAVWVLQWNGVHGQCGGPVSVHSVLAGPALLPACSKTQWVQWHWFPQSTMSPHWAFTICFVFSLSGSEFTPPPEYHHGHSDRPQCTAGTGNPRCHSRRPCHCPGPLLTACHSGQYAPHVTVQSRLSKDWEAPQCTRDNKLEERNKRNLFFFFF